MWPATGSRLADVALRAAEGVDLDALGAVDPAQVAVVVPLEPGLADDVVARGAAEPGLVDLGRLDLADGAEQLRGERVQRVAAQPHLLDADARELVLALLQVAEHGRADVGLQRHVGVGQQRLLLGDLARDVGELLDAVAGHRARRRAGRGAEHERQPAVAAGQPGRVLRQVGRRHLDGDRRHRIDQDVAAAVDDLAARRRDRDRPAPGWSAPGRRTCRRRAPAGTRAGRTRSRTSPARGCRRSPPAARAAG